MTSNYAQRTWVWLVAWIINKLNKNTMNIEQEFKEIKQLILDSYKADYEDTLTQAYDKLEELEKQLTIPIVVGQSEQFSLADMKEAYQAGENNAGSYTYPPFEEWFSKR